MPLLRSKVVWILAGFALSVGASTSRLTAQQGTASVTGVVTDATTQRPIQGAQVVVAGTNLSAVTNQSGRYLILNAPVGTRDVRVQLRWYGPLTRSVTLTAGSSSVTDFALTPSVVDLEGTTVDAITGMQSRNRERGTSSGLLEVASDITPAAVTSVSDILSGRMEGLVLQDMGGTVGTSQRIRIRGATSLSLLNGPLVFLDEVRMNTNGQEGLFAVGGQEPSRLNDINPNDIESIEVLKGAAAAALYGTGAANGVLLITTKRGAAGDAKWNFYAEYGQLEDRTDYGTSYVSNSIVDGSAPFLLTNSSGDPTSINRRAYPFCSNRDVADGACTQEISQDFNTLLDPRTTPFTKGFTRKFGMSVAGGDDRTTYFISGEISDEVGVIDYNTEDKFNVRANFQSAIRDDLDAFVTFGYTSSQLDLNSNDNSIFSPLLNGLLSQGVFFAPRADDPDQVNRSNQGFGFNSADLQEFLTMQDIDRFTLGMNSSYRPLNWLTANLNMGMDLTSRHDFRTLHPDKLPTAFFNGSRESARTNNVLFTGNGSLSAIRELSDWVLSTSTAGISFQKSRLSRTECFGAELVPGATSCGATRFVFRVDEDFSQEVTVGGFFQQRLAMWDRLFVSGSIRGDDNSSFGELAGWEYYPSAEVSWVVGEEAWFPTADWVGELRVRAAFGVSGLPPAFRQATPLFDPVTVSIGDEDVPGISLGAAGNALLEPERTTEYEIGFDAALFGDRIGLHYTYFTKTTGDVLIESRLAPSLGLTETGPRGLTETGPRNLGRISNDGHEIGASVAVIDRPSVGLDLDVATSFFNNEIDDLGEVTQDIRFGFRGSQLHQVGRAAGSFFQQEVFFDDADGNGKLSLSEVTLGDTAVFLGEALPQWQTSVHVGLRLWDWVRVTSLFEGRGGNAQFNFTEAFKCGFRATRGCAAVADPNASLESQAAYLSSRFLGSSAGYIEAASFIRWRELAVTLRAPASLARDVPGLDALSFTVAGRNLNIWTDYSGIDPEVVSAGGDSNFDQSEFNTQPPVRSIVFRLNYSF